MSTTPREIGTLVVVILKAQHLPNKRHIGKQDPYCCVTLSGDKRRTRAIKRGGQHPEWDEEVRFTLYEDIEDTLARAANGGETPPPPPPKEKDSKKKKKVKGGNAMMVACYADDPKEPELIGETVVDLSEVLTKGETDEWFTLQNKDKFSGEVYLELTFWSNEKPPEKKSRIKPMRSSNQYGGPGSFVSSESESSFSNGDNGSAAPSLRSSSSLAQLSLYSPPYESQNARTVRSQGTGSTLNQLADEFGGLSVGPGSGGPQRRRESFPPPRNGHTPRPSDPVYPSLNNSISYHSTGYSSGDYSDPGSSFSYEAPATPVARNHHRHSFGEPIQAYTPYQSPYDPNPTQSGGYSPSQGHVQSNAPSMYSIPSSSSGFAPVSTPTPSGYVSAPPGTPAPSGFMPPNTQTPAPTGYAPHPSQTPAPYGYGPQPTYPGFAPPPSAMGYHQQHPAQGYPAYQQYPPQPTSAPPMMYPPGPPSGVPPPSHSAPPQHYIPFPSPSHANPVQQYPAYTPSTPSPPQPPPQQYNPSPPVQGSRPLPMPGMQNGSYPATPPHPAIPTPPHPGSMVYTGTPPHMQTQVQSQTHPLPTPPGASYQVPSNTGPPPHSNGFIPPPPPPPLRRLSGPPAPPSAQYTNQQGSPEAANGRGQSPARPPLPQPPAGAGGVGPLPPPPPLQTGSGFQPPPPPPPLTKRSASQSQSQHPLPYPPAAPPRSVKPGEIYNPGPPPRPPAQVVYDSTTGFWTAPPQ